MKTKTEICVKTSKEIEKNLFRPTERTITYMDRQNIEINFSKVRYSWEHIDYRRLFNCLTEGTELVESKIFDSIKSKDDKKNAILDYLASSGFSVIKRVCSHQQKGVDIDIALNLMKDADNDLFDTAVLISGDGDFVPAVDYVRSLGKEVIVASYKSGLSKNLSEAADSVVILDNMPILKLGDTEAKIRDALPKVQYKPVGRNYEKKRKNEIERMIRRCGCGFS